MSLQEQAVGTNRQLARLLQIGMVLEELVETDATRHRGSDVSPAVEQQLAAAATEARTHRERLAALLTELDAEPAGEELAPLVEAQYTPDRQSDGVLYDQLTNAETAYKFFDDLLGAIEATDATFAIDRDRLIAELERIRADEKDGVETVTQLMES